jgi:hypothetical protein
MVGDKGSGYVSWAAAKLEGEIVRLGANDPLEAHRVLVWMQIGPANLDVADLGSTFVRKNPPPESLPQEFREGLIGGRNGHIALVPASGKEQIPGNAAVTVLELELSAARV